MMEKEDSILEQTEIVAQSVDSEEQWASLFFPVINRVVLALKKTKRWRLDGRSLRLLNRHWSTAISLHVGKIRPHPRRSLVDSDVTSLRKFMRATSVDISPFLIDPLNNARTRHPKNERSLLVRRYSRQLKRIVDTLCRMPNLSRIEIGHDALMICDPLRSDAGEQWSRLEGITHVYCYGTENLKHFGDNLLSTTSMFYEGMYKSISRCLEELVHRLPRVGTLEVEASILSSEAKLDFLEKVRRVKFHGVNEARTAMHLPVQSITISSITLSESAGFDFSFLDSLADLSSLRLAVDSWAVLNSQSFIFAVQRLKVLEIAASEGDDDITLPNEIFEVFTHLQSLSLESCIFNGAALLGNLPVLRGLRILKCIVKDSDTTFITEFHELELLLWEHIICPHYHWLTIPLEETILPKLRSLSISPILDDSVLVSLSRRTDLEVLSVGFDSTDALSRDFTNGVSALEKLQNLRILRIDGTGKRENPVCAHLLSLGLIMKLEQLWLVMDFEELDEHKEKIEDIQREAPHLIVEKGEQADSFPPHLFRQACFL